MKVYSVLRHMQYEGSDLLGVFGSREDALKFVDTQTEDRKYYDFGVVESELGQKVDFYMDVEWVE
jgi:hypothetical protein